MGFSAYELGQDFKLTDFLNRGYLPSHYLDSDYYLSLRSYVGDYLKEEIFSEGLVRNLPTFTRFLEVAAIGDSEIINNSNIGRETSVSSKTVQSYFDILVDTLVGQYLPAYTKKPKRRIIQSPKFYFHDVGVVNFLAHRKNLKPKTSEFGKAFENWIFHELQCFIKYSLSDYPLSFWQLTTGVEVDFILGDMQIAIEAKSTEKVNDGHLKNLREIKKDYPSIKERIVVSLDRSTRRTEDGILILPYKEFIKRLWQNPLNSQVDISFQD